jgi:hypothetical protein
VPGTSQRIKIGKDKITGMGEMTLLSDETIACLHKKNIWSIYGVVAISMDNIFNFYS